MDTKMKNASKRHLRIQPAGLAEVGPDHRLLEIGHLDSSRKIQKHRRDQRYQHKIDKLRQSIEDLKIQKQGFEVDSLASSQSPESRNFGMTKFYTGHQSRNDSLVRLDQYIQQQYGKITPATQSKTAFPVTFNPKQIIKRLKRQEKEK